MNLVKKSRATLFRLISNLEKNRKLCFRNPEKDFTRKRKLSFSVMMKLFLSMAGSSINKELLNYFQFQSDDIVTDSAFCQQRAKIKSDAFRALFHLHKSTINCSKKYNGYRLLACDGSTLWTSIKSPDIRYTCQSGTTAHTGGFLHLNAIYDILNNTYIDELIEPDRKHNEKRALIQMLLEHPLDEKSIIIMDRGYESYNIMAHISHMKQFYLIRIKDNQIGGFSRFFDKPASDEYDVVYTRKFTRKTSRKYLNKNDEYVTVRHPYDMDFFTSEHDMYEMTFRLIRIKIDDDKYECFVTNLPKYEFDMYKIKELYGLRWGIESAFRDLKYSVGLNYFTGKNEEFVRQEIYARLTMYNFCRSIIYQIILDTLHKKNKYKIDFKNAVNILKMYIRQPETPPDHIVKCIKSKLIPVRPGRSAPRNKYFKTPVFAQYKQ